MAWNNKVVWSEGMFLRPHHFQQQDRYLHNLVESRCAALRPYAWGFAELKIDEQMLSLGKVALASCSGVLPDGTPFNVPGDDEPPLPLDVPENAKNVVINLALPVRSHGTVDTEDEAHPDGLGRYLARDYEVRDYNATSDATARVQVGKLGLRLVFDDAKHGAYTSSALARIAERRPDGQVILDEEFIPSCIDCHSIPQLSGFVKELLGLLHHRGEALAARLSQSGSGGVAEIADFLLLQTVNRFEPVFSHLAELDGLHPEALYQVALQLAGELSTFTGRNKRPARFSHYRHDDLQTTFSALAAEIRQSLSMVLEQNAIPIPLEERKYGIRVATVPDRKLLGSADFVLAVNAEVSGDVLRSSFPTQVKIGPVEKIRDLVNLQLPGIGVRALPVAPRQIPYHAGYTYLEFDRSSDYWKQLETSGGFAMHVAGEFPGIDLALWAIKG